MEDQNAVITQMVDITEVGNVILKQITSDEFQKAISTCEFKDKDDFARGAMFGMAMANIYIATRCTKFPVKVIINDPKAPAKKLTREERIAKHKAELKERREKMTRKSSPSESE